MEAGLPCAARERVTVKREPLEHSERAAGPLGLQGFEFVGVKQEPLEDPEAEEFLPQEPECILVQQDNACDGAVQSRDLQPTQVHENGVHQKEPDTWGGGDVVKEEEVILGLVPEAEWVPPLPASDETATDPLASEGSVITDSMNEEPYEIGWGHISDESQCVPPGEGDYSQLALIAVNSGGPAYDTFPAKNYKSDGTETVQQAFRCDSCSAIFSTKYHLVNHVFTHLTEVPPPSHVCRRCGEVFCDTASLIDHSKGHENSPAVPAVFSKWSRGPAGAGRSGKGKKKYRVRKRPETKPHICDVCGKAFPLPGNLNLHKRTHTGERPYTCEVCGKAFMQSVHLRNHGVTHGAEKRHYCEFCGRAFSLLHTLKVHRRMHTGENPYRCDVCGASFNLLGKLKTHKQIHTGRKPYKCDECGNCFAAPNSLRRHKRMHSGEKPYSCSVCGEYFMWSATLKRHMQVHTGEKPFKCDLCSSSFAEMGGLNRHMRIHTGERPYACDICGASFMASNHLKRHLHTQHVANTVIFNV